MSGPLAGFTVIDVCRARPGRFATGLLADYGADVVSIAEPGHAERRAAGGAAAPELGRLNQRNKRSLLLNLRHPQGREIFFRLVARADAVLESNRPGATRRLGIDYEAVRRVNPAVVYCSLSGFGQDGPYAGIAAHDLAYQAVGGLVPLDAEGRPHPPPYNHADLNAARAAALALVMGLLERTRSGQGQYIDVAFADAAVTIPPGRLEDEMLCGEYPCYQIYETGDGRYLALSVREPWFWERLCDLLGKREWVPHLRPRGALREEMFTFFRAAFRARTLAEWVRVLRERDIEFAPLNRTVEELAADPHLRQREMVLEVPDPLGGGPRYEPGFALKFSRTRARLRRGPSLMGADTDAILRELGYEDAEVAALRAAAVIG